MASKIGLTLEEVKDKDMEKMYMEFANYDQTGDATPQYTEKPSKNGWIEWGKNNLYPMYLISLTNRSPLHNAIVHLKASMIGQNGFINTKWTGDTILFLKNLSNQDDLDEIVAKWSLDLVIFGGFCANIIWSKDKKHIAEINYISPDSVRIAIPDPDTKYPAEENYYVCEDWKNWRKCTPIFWHGFSSINKSEPSQILYVKEHRSSNNYYPIPEYLAGVASMELNYKINEYHLSTINNEFSPSFHINFPFIPASDEQRTALVSKLKQDFRGVKKAGNEFITFSQNKDLTPTISPVPTNDNDNKWLAIMDSMFDTIITSHRLTDKNLLGLESGAAGIEAKNELLESLSVFQAMYVAPKQTFIERIINKLARINGLSDKILLEKYYSNLTPNLPISDLIALLSSPIDERQMVEILISKGYDRDQALLIVNKEKKEQPVVAPVAAPTKIN